MGDSNKYDKEALRWRDKYFSLSEEQEKAERDYAAYLNVLQRALVRISLAADGQDKELDKQLGGLRNMLRKEPVDQAGIRNHLESIESAILRLDKQRNASGSQGLGALQQLVEQLTKLNLSRERQKAIKHYAKVLKAQGDQLAVYPALLHEYSQLQQAALIEVLQSSNQGGGKDAESGKGLMSRIFGKKSTHGSAEDGEVAVSQVRPTSEISEPVVNSGLPDGHAAIGVVRESALPIHLEPPASTEAVEEQGALRVRAEAEVALANENEVDRDKDESSRSEVDVAAVINALVELLEQLPLPIEARNEAEKLRDQLKHAGHPLELERIIDGAAELVLQALGSSQHEFEQFLSGLDNQLAEINAYLTRHKASGAGRIGDSQQLNNLVRNQVSGITQSVGEAADINSLKTSVQTQLQAIVGSVDDFVTAETQREQALEQELEAMREKLDIIQSEAQAIRKKLHNETLRALTDTLTHIPNREAFDERFSLERERYLRYKHPVCIAMLDIDHFKRVNDNHGHLVGDRVLQDVARTIKKLIRKTDFVARYGGEEFVVILPETTLEQSEIALNKIKEAIACMSIKALGAGGKVTLSAGVAAFQLGELGEELVERADKALYQAKVYGRNKVVAAE